MCVCCINPLISDYDSKKSAKRRTATKKVVQPAGVKRGRGRPAGSGRNKGRGPGRPKKNKATEEVSDDADGEGEVVYNDHVSEKEHSDEGCQYLIRDKMPQNSKL